MTIEKIGVIMHIQKAVTERVADSQANQRKERAVEAPLPRIGEDHSRAAVR